LGKTLVAVGLGIAILGGLLWAVASFVPGLQPVRLPGDIVIERPGVKVYFPVVTSLVVSVVLSLVLWFLRSLP